MLVHKLEPSEGAATVLHPHANGVTCCTVYMHIYIYMYYFFSKAKFIEFGVICKGQLIHMISSPVLRHPYVTDLR